MPPDTVLYEVADAVEHVAAICFKTGPPRRIGVELEWTVHRADAPAAYLNVADLRAALGAHAPDGPAAPLPTGGAVTVEPGGQIEISSAPAMSPAELYAAVTADVAYLSGLLTGTGLVLGDTGLDPHRPPRRLLQTPRYAAMQRAFDARGPHGRTMMCSTAGLQVCLDAGEPNRVQARWAAAHEVGPALLAAFATSRWHAGRDTGWASGRMAVWYGMDPARTRPAGPLERYAQYALAAPLLCLRRPGEAWDAPGGTTFADWIGGALPGRPTVDDLDYHLSTLFPPVRPRGYLEVRYLDAQPGGEWIAPAAVLAVLFADDATTDAAREIAAPAAGRWTEAARDGLADPVVAGAAAGLLDLACRGLDRTDLPPDVCDLVTEIVDRRLRGAAVPRKDPLR